MSKIIKGKEVGGMKEDVSLMRSAKDNDFKEFIAPKTIIYSGNTAHIIEDGKIIDTIYPSQIVYAMKYVNWEHGSSPVIFYRESELLGFIHTDLDVEISRRVLADKKNYTPSQIASAEKIINSVV